jgi:hypothetical protein
LAELEQDGFINIEISPLTTKGSVVFYSLVADEGKVRNDYFRPEQKISHHVGLRLFHIAKPA